MLDETRRPVFSVIFHSFSNVGIAPLKNGLVTPRCVAVYFWLGLALAPKSQEKKIQTGLTNRGASPTVFFLLLILSSEVPLLFDAMLATMTPAMTFPFTFMSDKNRPLASLRIEGKKEAMRTVSIASSFATLTGSPTAIGLLGSACVWARECASPIGRDARSHCEFTCPRAVDWKQVVHFHSNTTPHIYSHANTRSRAYKHIPYVRIWEVCISQNKTQHRQYRILELSHVREIALEFSNWLITAAHCQTIHTPLAPFSNLHVRTHSDNSQLPLASPHSVIAVTSYTVPKTTLTETPSNIKA